MCDKRAFRPAESVRQIKPKTTFECPKCQYPQFCGCPSCKDKIPSGYKPYNWNANEEITCANCGYTAHVNEWNELAYRQFKEQLNSKDGVTV